MITVVLETDGDGALKSVKAEGHAFFAVKGKDIVCAGVSTLLLTALNYLESIEGLKITADLSKRGKLAVSVLESGAEYRDRLKFLADFLRTGLSGLELTYPKNVELRENTEQ